MDGFRSLGDEEEVEFECKPSDKGFEATIVTGVSGDIPKGSHRRPMSKKKFKKIRCYNCGDFGTHVAAKCSQGPQPKKCHHCKATEHLIADCPKRKGSSNKQRTTSGGGGSAGDAASSNGSTGQQSATSDLGSEEDTCFHSSEDQEKNSDK